MDAFPRKRRRYSEYRKGDDMKKKKKKKSWSDLPEDLVASIMKRLYVADRIRFRAVCKQWSVQSSDQVGVKAIDKLPWTMEYKFPDPTAGTNSGSCCKLYEPLNHNRTLSYVVETGRIDDWRSRGKCFVDAQVYASRDGWVLLFNNDSEKFFFFNPYTKQVIFIPPPMNSACHAGLATFSSAPDSPNCFVFLPYYEAHNFRAEIYSHADKAWTIYNLKTANCSSYLLGEIDAVCYMKGTFYCHFRNYHLAAINMINVGQEEQQQQPRITVMATYLLEDDDNWWLESYSPPYLLECDGDMYLAYLSYFMHLYVMKLDWERKEWVRVRNLEGRALFLDKTSFGVSAGGETEIIANRVYYYAYGFPYFQTLDGREHNSPCIRHYSPSLENIIEVEKPKIYGCCRTERKIAWIQPPKDF